MALGDRFLYTQEDMPFPYPQGMTVLSVTELTHCIRAVIETEGLFADVWVRGEISNFSRHSSGHTYFCLKDEGALIRCVIWRNTISNLAFELADGLGVIVRGRVTVYEKQGQYQLMVNEVKADGVGTLYAALEQLKARLRAEGLFEQARKKPIPPFPRTIALVTSPTGAAVQDMITIAKRRFPAINILILPTLMQGEGADASVIQSLRVADNLPNVDLIIIGRGGGSLEDLWTFNMESVVYAIAACKKPVVSAIGHETDYTLADFAADQRAPTPSAAIEHCIPDWRELASRLSAQVDAIVASMSARIERWKSNLDYITKSRCFTHPEAAINERWQILDSLNSRLTNCIGRLISNCQGRLGEVSGRLEALSPLHVLSRGYAIVKRSRDAQVVKSIYDVESGEITETLVSDGTLISEIRNISKGWPTQ